ncbi:DNA topoisomerase IV subunit A [Francisella orientalis]|uniref:DNA topoisomerase 4 subunit A n=1 Tax=Francisella orientalis TaxID=299583 RepID=A0AAP7C5W9_9GAMM|nr:DNA topoisomerase IV subunit A [Francisella orientalis]AFJ43503.1 DNA topoisomerase IV subunit A [Francisella orientalis str. Toba 04]AHB98090.1 DNA topoisomerase IV subunit A [Francisella orientalis LADL 07-285A]AKN85227.1 DNA topoisomerase 4 subunit A [Francisella orientalis FNO12]AKN86766.1 DNA topoisomerase 4 subunit A [Francisella orientalis FNO24]AKN88305.1 DNA topoisomerase 4 subunit A [Francisella orientalis]
MDLLSSLESTQSVGEFSEQAYLNYSMYVILDRALPHISDGLKPVQRRIIYAMSEIGLSHLSKYKKSARTVGDVLGKYHPHGDSACYEAMVLMAQNFSYRYPFIDGQGNWGSIDDPKSFAAMRYTESRLSKYAVLLLDELKKGTVDWVKNFDGTMDEPKLLPAQVPNIILNGAMGIAVGMSTYIPPHNITEVINACLHLLSNPKASIEEVLEIIDAPDYPGGANIISSKEEIAEVYKSGNGSIRQQAVYEYDNHGNVIITRLPHQVSSASVMEQIANQLKQQKITWIKNIQDESDDKEPVKIVLYSASIKKNIQKIMGHLLATTDLEKSFRVNMNMIGLDNRPQVKNLLDILNEWLEYRRYTLRRRLQTSLDKVLDRLHILEGMLIAFLNIDEVINIIRNYDDPSLELQSRFALSEIQAEAILNIRLRKLAKIEEIEIKKEQKELQKEKELLEGYLNSEVKFKNLMKKELKQILSDFGDSRRSKIVQADKAQALEEKDLMPSERVTVILSKAGWVRCAKGDNIDPKGLSYKPEDKPYLATSGNSNIKLVFFTKLGKAYSMYVDKFPSARGYGEHITAYIPLDKEDEIINIEFANVAEHFLIASTSGKGFVIPAEDLIANKITGKNIFDADDVFKFIPYDKDFKMLAVSSQGRAIIRDFESFAVLKKGKGKTIIKLDKKDKLKFIELFKPEQELTLNAGKRFIRIDNRNFETYYTDKSSGGGVLLPQGFRKITKIDIESIE